MGIKEERLMRLFEFLDRFLGKKKQVAEWEPKPPVIWVVTLVSWGEIHSQRVYTNEKAAYREFRWILSTLKESSGKLTRISETHYRLSTQTSDPIVYIEAFTQSQILDTELPWPPNPEEARYRMFA